MTAPALTARYGADPVPWLAPVWADALTAPAGTARAALALTALGTVIGGLADDERPYTVRYAGDPVGAATDLKGRTVHVGSAPLDDAALTPGQVAAIMTGLAFHEACHIRYTRHIMDAYDAFPGDRARAHRVGNIAEDIRGEALGCEAFPGLAATLPVTLAWVAGRTMPHGKVRAATMRDRMNVMLGATRYPAFIDWTGAEGERATWESWAERAAAAHTVALHTAVVREALDMLDAPTPADPESGDEPGEDGDDEGEPTGDEPTGEGKGEGKPDQGDAEGNGGDDAEGDDGAGDADGEGDGDPGDGEATDGEATDGDGPVSGTVGEGASKGDRTGGERTDAPEVALPECPTEAGKSGAEDRMQDTLDNVGRAVREVGGTRTYPGGRVSRAVQRQRGTGVRPVAGATTPEGTVGFMAPNVGRAFDKPAYGTHTVAPTVRPHVSRALAGAIAGARKGDPTPTAGQRAGTLDRTRLARVASGDCRVFTNRVIPGPQRIRAIVLLDASGSMSVPVDADAARKLARKGESWQDTIGTRATAAAQIGVDMAGAFALMPNVKGAVYAHNLNAGGSTVHALWQSGEPVAYAGDYANLDLDGNSDDLAIRYCTDDLIDARQSGEALVLIVVSDGAPPDAWAVKAAVAEARARGVAVVSVAIATEAEDGQRLMYGEDVVLFTPEPMILARRIAQAIGKRI